MGPELPVGVDLQVLIRISRKKEKGLRETAALLRCPGGAEGDRTPDLHDANVALSQLSYRPRYLHSLSASGGAAPALPGALNSSSHVNTFSLKHFRFPSVPCGWSASGFHFRWSATLHLRPHGLPISKSAVVLLRQLPGVAWSALKHELLRIGSATTRLRASRARQETAFPRHPRPIIE